MFGIATNETGFEIMGTYEAWDKYMGHIWYNMLTFCNLQEESTVIEFACGNSTKLGIALNKSHFKGQLYLVDPCLLVLEELGKKCQKLLPEANIHLLPKTLNTALKELPTNPDFIVANHALDDMLLEASAGDAKCDFFQWSLHKNEDLSLIYQDRWELLLKNEERLSATKEKTICNLIKVIHELRPKHFIVNQYPSYVLTKNNLNSLNKHAKDVLLQLKSNYAAQIVKKEIIQVLLNANKNYNNLQIGTEVLNAENWVVLQESYGT